MYNEIMTFFKMLIVSINKQENNLLLYKTASEVSAVFNLYEDHFHLIQLELFKLH